MELVILENFGDIRSALGEIDCKNLCYAIYDIEEGVLECASDNAPPELVQRRYGLSDDAIEDLYEEVDEDTPHIVLGYDFGRDKAYAIAATHDLGEASAAMCEVATVVTRMMSGQEEPTTTVECMENGDIVFRDPFGNEHVVSRANSVRVDCVPENFGGDLKADSCCCNVTDLDAEDFDDDDDESNIGLQLRRLSIFRHSRSKQ